MSGGKTIEVLSAEKKDVCVQQAWRVGDGEGRTGEREGEGQEKGRTPYLFQSFIFSSFIDDESFGLPTG